MYNNIKIILSYFKVNQIFSRVRRYIVINIKIEFEENNLKYLITCFTIV